VLKNFRRCLDVGKWRLWAAACRVLAQRAALTETWRRWGHEIGFGIGIAHGFATLGTIGFEGRFDYAAIQRLSIMKMGRREKKIETADSQGRSARRGMQSTLACPRYRAPQRTQRPKIAPEKLTLRSIGPSAGRETQGVVTPSRERLLHRHQRGCYPSPGTRPLRCY
jgi:hypothetical protein